MGAWVVMSLGFGFYLRVIANYGSVFGDLATFVVLVSTSISRATSSWAEPKPNALVREHIEGSSSAR